MPKTRYTAEVRYTAQMRGLVSEVRRASRAQQQSIRGVTDELRKQTRGWRGLGNEMVRINQSVQLIRTGFGALNRIWDSTVGLAARQRSGIRQLDNTLKNTIGVTYGQLADRIESFADAQQAATRFGDDVTRATMRDVSQALRGVAESYEEIERATGLAQDVQESMGINAMQVGRIVARAVDGQLRSLNTLLPVHSQLDDALEGVTDKGRRLELILNELESAYGGNARALDEQEQAVAELESTWGDFREALGNALLFVTPLLNGLVTALTAAKTAVENFGDAFRHFFAHPFGLGEERLLTAHERIRDALTRLEPGIQRLMFLRRAIGLSVPPPSVPSELEGQIESTAGALREHLGDISGGGGRPPRDPRTAREPSGGGGGGGGGSRTPGRRGPLGPRGPLSEAGRGIQSIVSLLADSAQEGVQRLRDAQQQALEQERQVLNEQKRLILEAEQQRLQALEKQTALIQNQIELEKLRRESIIQTSFTAVQAASDFAAGIIGAEKAFAHWRRLLALVEAAWRLVWGDFSGAAKASAVVALSSAALDFAGGFLGGGGGGGGGGDRTPGRSGEGTGAAPPPGALLSRPAGGGNNRPIVLQVRFDEDRARGALATVVRDAIQFGELRL